MKGMIKTQDNQINEKREEYQIFYKKAHKRCALRKNQRNLSTNHQTNNIKIMNLAKVLLRISKPKQGKNYRIMLGWIAKKNKIPYNQ
jgi:hypothetical protein